MSGKEVHMMGTPGAAYCGTSGRVSRSAYWKDVTCATCKEKRYDGTSAEMKKEGISKMTIEKVMCGETVFLSNTAAELTGGETSYPCPRPATWKIRFQVKGYPDSEVEERLFCGKHKAGFSGRINYGKPVSSEAIAEEFALYEERRLG